MIFCISRNTYCIWNIHGINDRIGGWTCSIVYVLWRKYNNQSVSMLLSCPSDSLLACSWMARKNGSTPVPASSGNPNPLTSPPSIPVRNAWSKFCTAERNCGELIIRWRVSGDGGVGRSGGRCGKRAGTRSGWAANSGVRFDGVKISERKSSLKI